MKKKYIYVVTILQEFCNFIIIKNIHFKGEKKARLKKFLPILTFIWSLSQSTSFNQNSPNLLNINHIRIRS